MTGVRTLTELREPLRKVEKVSPQRALALLSRNRTNRPVRDLIVEQYAGAMKRGEWHGEAGEPVYVAVDGWLLNGQHRLKAIVKADVEVELPFVYDAPEDVFLVADTGAKRTFGDILSIKGVPNARAVASLISAAMGYQARGRFASSGGYVDPTNIEKLKFWEQQNAEDLQHAVKVGRQVARRGLMTTTGLASSLWWEMHRVDPKATDPFFEAAISGVGLAPGNAVLALRRTLAGMEQRRHSGAQPSQPMVAALWIKAFNYWREGREIQQLAWRPGQREPFPTIDPPLEGG